MTPARIPLTLRSVLVGLVVFAAARPASAQQPSAASTAQVVDLNRQAMEAYTNLEVERALTLLNQALQVAQTNRVTGAPLARTHLNRGVVQVGGLADNAAGIDAFKEALRADPNIRLDPITSSPDIESAFALARQQMTAPVAPAPGGTAAPGATAGPGVPTPGGTAAPGATAAPGPAGPPAPGGMAGMIAHTPPTEQLEMTPVPIYIEVAPFVRVGAVFVWYRGLGMPDFQRVQMQPVGNGYGVEIDCMAAFAPQLVYYIGILDPQGVPVTYAGSPAQPIPVRIVNQRTGEPPHLPDRPPPNTCTAGGTECPPGMDADDPRCRNQARCGDGICTGSEDFSCPEDCLERPQEDTGPTLPQFFVALGFGAGFGTARTKTMTRPDGEVACSDELAALPPGDEAGDAACVDVLGGFTLIPPAIRLAGGFFFLDQFSLGASLRYQIIHETHDLVADEFVNYHFEVRLSYWLFRSLEKKLWLYGFVGSGYGAVEPQVTVTTRDGEKDVTVYQNAGLNNASAGIGAIYHFGDPGGFGLLGEVDFDQFFPTAVTAFDVWVGATYGF